MVHSQSTALIKETKGYEESDDSHRTHTLRPRPTKEPPWPPRP